ncbi:MAG: ATP-binding protein [Ignavibacteriae bacterium]|nr:ATP-binding protein [Ignavibacteriota bacterium]MCB9210110.1 ATP-binding protein [Ignavibacteriales bacterium]MCB9218505.1 ATP-binding protein [Ignavibacteriales bacterium]MCB9259489.1 ATP-binding protein [Ignavibacteriales bacterium]
MRKRLTVKSSTKNLAKIRTFVKKLSTEVGFDDETANKIVLATDEACTNIIKHAYKYSQTGIINVNISLLSDKFRIAITDEGSHFNSNAVPEPDLKKYYEEKRVGGLGMFLMKKLMDEVIYSQPTSKKNKVTLIKYLK